MQNVGFLFFKHESTSQNQAWSNNSNVLGCEIQDAICKTIAEQHGIEFVLGALVEAANTENKSLAKSACSFLSQVQLFIGKCIVHALFLASNVTGFKWIYFIFQLNCFPFINISSPCLCTAYKLQLSDICLLQLAGSDDNKDTIVNEGGLEKLINVTFVFSEDPPVLQEVSACI